MQSRARKTTSTLCKLAIFDLDGTILDTLADLAASTNAALQAHALPLRSVDEVRQFVGNGIRNLIVRAVCAASGVACNERMSAAGADSSTEPQAAVLVCAPADSSLLPLIDAVHAAFTAHYREHCADRTCAYDGIPALLSALRAAGVHTAVVSNKADYGVQELCARYFPALFDYAVGERADIRRKPAPDSVLHVMGRFGTAPADAVYIGDSDVDIATARNAGIRCISVTWGFRSEGFLRTHGATTLVSSPAELQAAILG